MISLKLGLLFNWSVFFHNIYLMEKNYNAISRFRYYHRELLNPTIHTSLYEMCKKNSFQFVEHRIWGNTYEKKQKTIIIILLFQYQSLALYNKNCGRNSGGSICHCFTEVVAFHHVLSTEIRQLCSTKQNVSDSLRGGGEKKNIIGIFSREVILST